MKKSQNQKCKLYEITSFECNRIYAFIWRKEDTSFIGSVIRKVRNQKKGKKNTYIINTIWRREHVRVLTP